MVDIPNRVELKMARAKVDTDGSGLAIVEFKIPTPERVMYGGFAWFNGLHVDDRLFEISIVDIDGIMSPAGTVLGYFTDNDMPADNQGWYVNKSGEINMPSIGGGETGLGDLWVRLKAQTGDSRPDTFRVNVRWGMRT
jgi:hypothetical protein